MIGIGIGIGIGGRRVQWSAYWISRSLFFLDGTIVTVGSDKYFKDKSDNARDFLITDYDLDVSVGFPYKSTATISAPDGDAALIAADINNFLYASDGTPNQIPVVSLFQDIDYEHKIFCQHSSQMLSDNGTELFEPRVLSIYMATEALSGNNLAKAQVEFGVPAEVTNAKWVAKNGNDTTGDGSKSLPFLTISKAASIVSGESVYVKTGIYIEQGGPTVNLLIQKTSNYVGIGNVVIQGGGTAVNVVLIGGTETTVTFSGFVVDADNAYNVAIYLNNAGKIISRCKCINALTRSLRIDSDNIANNCLFSGVGIQVDASSIGKIDTCYFAFDGTFLISNTNTGAFSYINNRIKTISGSSIYLSNLLKGENIFNGNTFDLTGTPTMPLFWCSSAGTTKFTFTHNNVFSSANITSPVLQFDATPVIDINISDNTFSLTGTNPSATTIISIYGQIDPVIDRNKFTQNTANQLALVKITSDVNTSPKIRYNKIFSKSTSGYIICVGTETTSANDNKITPEIVGNKIYGCLYYDETIAMLSTHSIFVGHNINPIIKYNYVNGGAIGCVVKHTGGTYTAGGVTHNIFKNCRIAILPKGVDGLKMVHNKITASTISETLVRIGIQTETHTIEASNLFIKNNIFNFPFSENSLYISINDGSEVGLISDYNLFYGASDLFKHKDIVRTLTEWTELDLDINSINTDPDLQEDLIPVSAIMGAENIGNDYDNGLDVSTDWGSDTEVPSVVTKRQGVTWQIGAYIQ